MEQNEPVSPEDQQRVDATLRVVGNAVKVRWLQLIAAGMDDGATVEESFTKTELQALFGQAAIDVLGLTDDGEISQYLH